MIKFSILLKGSAFYMYGRHFSRDWYRPLYDSYQDFNTNAKDYYDYLAKVNESFDKIAKLLEINMARDIDVEDTNTVDLTKIGEWIHELNPDIELVEQVIKIKADVILSEVTEPILLKSVSTFIGEVFEATNSIKKKSDGIFSKDLEPFLKMIDEKLDELNKRIDELDPEGADVLLPIHAQQIENNVPVAYKNLDTVISSIDQSKFNIAFITDLHLYPDSESLRNKNNFRVLEQFKKLANKTDVSIHCGDNVDSYSGAIGVDNDPMKPSEVKIATKANMKRFACAVNTYPKKPVLIVTGNHDRGGIPYATNKNHDLSMVLSKKEMEEITGQPMYGGTVFPDKKLGIFKVHSDDFSEQQSNGYFLETDNQTGYQTGLIGYAQFNAMANFFNSLPENYHLLIVAHIIIDKDKTGNGQVFNQVLNAYQKGVNYKIPANTLVGIENNSHGEIRFINEGKGTRPFIGYLAGHYHSETDFPKNTDRNFNMACLLNGFPKDGQQATENEGTFYNIEIDTNAKTLKCFGVGNATNFLNWKY